MDVERHRRLPETRESTVTGAGTFRREPILRARCCRLAYTEIAMADDKTKRAPQDAQLISLKEDYEVEYWTRKFGVTTERLVEALQKVGNSAECVGDELTRR